MLEEKPRISHLFKNILRKAVLLLACLPLFSFFIPLFGKDTTTFYSDIPVLVLDAKSGEPLIGVNIYTEDFRFQAVTDENGKATISGLGYRDVVLFTYIGYKAQELRIYEIRNKRGRILMETDITELEEITVVGRRDDPVSEIPYKVERITNKEIYKSSAQTAADLLEKNGNLFVQKSQMGGGSPIIRGFEANRVLLVVDGVRMNNAIYRNGHLQNAITIDPSILAQAEVIYGPGSLTYGSDALGGVVHYRTRDPELAFGTNDDIVLKTNASLRYAYANGEKAFHVDFNQGQKKWGTLSSFSIVDFDDLIAGNIRPAAYPKFGLRPVIPSIDLSERDKFTNPNPNQQWGTQYAQIDILQKIKYQPNERLYFVANFQWSSSSDVPRYDNLVETVQDSADLKWREWFYGPQQRILGSIKAKMFDYKYFDKATIIAAFQKVDEDRNKRKWRKNWRSVNEEDVYVYSLTADFDKFLTEDEKTTLSYGLDFSYNDVRSDAYEIYVRKGPQRGNILVDGDDIITRYPSQGSSMTTYGAYTNFKWRSENDVLSAEAGLRYSFVRLAGFFGANDPIDWPQNYIDGIYLNNDALTFGTGLTVNKNKWQFRALIASAFRSPNVDDFAQIREKNGFITVPNPNLKPEQALTYEVTVGKEIGNLKTDKVGKKTGLSLLLSATAFKTDLRNALTRKNFALPDGTNTLRRDNELLEIQANVNATSADVYGFSGNLLFKIGDKVSVESSINYTKGTSRFKDKIEGIEIDTIVPFAHIPPMYGRTSLTFKLGKWTVSPTVRYNGRKRPSDYAVASARIINGNEIFLRRDGTSDNIDYSPYGYINAEGDPCNPAEPRGDAPCAEGYAGTLAWTTYNVYTEYKINDNFFLNLSVENIADLHYRPFSSGVSGAGRNFIIGLRGNF